MTIMAYAVYMDSEISIAEGDSLEYTAEELIDGISDMFKEFPEDVELVFKREGFPKTVISLADWLALQGC